MQGLGSVTAAMTDGPFDIGDRVVSLSSSSQGPPLGLKGLVRCPGTACNKAACSDMLYTQGGAPLGQIQPHQYVCACVMGKLNTEICVNPHHLHLSMQVVGIYDEACEVLFDEIFPGGSDLQGR